METAYRAMWWGSEEHTFCHKKILECAERDNTAEIWKAAYSTIQPTREQRALCQKKAIECAEKENTKEAWESALDTTKEEAMRRSFANRKSNPNKSFFFFSIIVKHTTITSPAQPESSGPIKSRFPCGTNDYPTDAQRRRLWVSYMQLVPYADTTFTNEKESRLR